MQDVENEVKAFQREKLEELASRPRTTVYDVVHDFKSDPWPAERARKVMESVARRLKEEFSDEERFSDFAVRKKCMEDEEVLAFQRQHPKLYWMITDREKMKNETYRGVISSLLELRKRVDDGSLQSGEEADATATKVVTTLLQSQNRE